MNCSKSGLKSLTGVLPRWGSHSAGRGWSIWESQMRICDEEFDFLVVEKEGRYTGELSGHG